MDNKKYYFQDNPIDNYEDDYVGFEEEVNMIKEGIQSNSRIIGLISDYGSGKSTIIKLLDNVINKDEYNIININLFDPDGVNNKFEAHKRLLVQLANNKYKNDKMKLSYIIKRINPNYRSINISTKSKISFVCIVISIFLLCISFLYSNNLLHYLNFLANTKFSSLVPVIKELCRLSGFAGFILLFVTIMKSDIVCNYLNNDPEQELNEFDLIEISQELIDEKRKTILVIEDLDRLSDPKEIETFIKELNIYYKSMSNTKFIIAVTPDEFMEMSNNENNARDSKYKPFNLIVNLPSIKNSDYEIILKKLLNSNKETLNKLPDFDLDQVIDYWTWLSFGNDLNIRRVKHRINGTIHLYKTLCNRFKGRYVEIKTCIAITYLKDEYESEYLKLIQEDGNGQFALKSIIDEFIVKGDINDKNSPIMKDIYELLKGDYLDSNIEMYCFNYSKFNEIFNSDEYHLNDAYLKNIDYNISDETIEKIIENDDKSLIRAIEKRIKLGIGIPSNVFERCSIINYLLKTQSKEILASFYKNMLQVDLSHISSTEKRLSKIKNSDFYNEDNVSFYLENIYESTVEQGNMESIEKSRKILYQIFKEQHGELKRFFDDNFPLITDDEMKCISNNSILLDYINLNKITDKNLKTILENVDNNYKDEDSNLIVGFINSLGSSNVDYCFKNCKSLSKLNDEIKEDLFNDNIDNIEKNSIMDLKIITQNFNYSFENLEIRAIEMYDSGKCDKNEYAEYVHSLPNVHQITLTRLLNDDCIFEIGEKNINSFKEKNMYYGYVKFKTFNDDVIPIGGKKISDTYEQIYSNENNIFDNYISHSNNFLKYIKENNIYEKYDNHRFMNMRFITQSKDLLYYAFNKLNDEMLSDYVKDISGIEIYGAELDDFITKYSEKLKTLSESARRNIREIVEGKRYKLRLAYLWRKK